ncbi:prephenate dehydratase [Thraustotheca clavata]|uniref:Prephenate dehydratase n=1 Tax=Thraustotheca clavata TaxID=74557 RepID=A0A1V9YHL5_9STRA|nr:prephenate dehydratase [Thraustotheca clavata]
MAVVDQHVPFYKLPTGLPAPGEACGCIKPGDILIGINNVDVRSYPFEAIVERLRNLEHGSTMLEFRSPAYLPLVEVSMASDEDDCAKLKRLEKRNLWLEQELCRERKCRALVDKKVDMYKEEVLRLSQENVELRVETARSKNLVRSKDEFIARTHLLL